MNNMKFDGMTVNERLSVSGLIEKFDAAVKEKEIEKVKEILLEVELTEESIKPILQSIFQS